MIKFKSLNRSKDFIKILKKRRMSNKYFTIYFDKNSENINKYLHNLYPLFSIYFCAHLTLGIRWTWILTFLDPSRSESLVVLPPIA